MSKKKQTYLGQDIQTQVLCLSQYSNEVLAAALIFCMANNLADQDPASDSEFTSIIDNAGEEALSLAESINILYNTKEITKH